MKTLTAKQNKVFEYLCSHIKEHGFPPTMSEIGAAIDLANINAVKGHLSALEKKGYISRMPDKARGIRIVRTPSAFSRIKKSLHQFARTDKGVVHKIVYGLALKTNREQKILTGKTEDRLKKYLEKRGVEHEWEFLDIQICADHLVVVVEVWPNHSPSLVASRIRESGNSLRLKHYKEMPKHRLWAKGYAVTTDLSRLDEMVKLFLEGDLETKDSE